MNYHIKRSPIEIVESYQVFLDRIFKELNIRKIDVSGYPIDHLAFRTSSENAFAEYKEVFPKLGVLIHENYISDNWVQIYRLRTPMKYQNQDIYAIELIDPNAKINYPTDYEHAEFVINEKFEDLIKRYPDQPWNISAMNRPEFPMIKLQLGEFFQVKFNHIPVLDMAEMLNGLTIQ